MSLLTDGAALEATALRCTRGERTLFSDLSFTLRGGDLLRIAGANGSGKTSLLRIACGLLEANGGAVRWRGEDVRRLREDYSRELVYLGHAPAVKDDLTARENLEIACALGGIAAARVDVRGALASLGLAGCEELPARVLSQGQRRRVTLARLVLARAIPLWMLDEPFTALDPAATDRVRALIAEHVARGGSVLYTTHHEVPIAAGRASRIDLGGGRP
ncbi:MAG TPA: cytochrome c biogenesis heme-transporting ATPase CcmA [Burkholderiales bacterium]